MTTHTETIEDEAGELFGIYYDQVQADYHRLWEIGVNDGTHAALMVRGLVPYNDFYDEVIRSNRIGPRPDTGDDSPYWNGYDAAYANTMTPEIMACFGVKA